MKGKAKSVTHHKTIVQDIEVNTDVKEEPKKKKKKGETREVIQATHMAMEEEEEREGLTEDSDINKINDNHKSKHDMYVILFSCHC